MITKFDNTVKEFLPKSAIVWEHENGTTMITMPLDDLIHGISEILPKVEKTEKSFKWAIDRLKEGKLVRRPSWDVGSYWKIGIDGKICWKDDSTAHIHLNQIDSMDWEIFEEIRGVLSLKDLKLRGISSSGTLLSEKELKKEAIRDIKMLNRTAIQRNNNHFGPTIEYIKHKFDLKEEDLK